MLDLTFESNVDIEKFSEERKKQYEEYMNIVLNAWFQTRNPSDVMYAMAKMNFTRKDNSAFKGDGNIYRLREQVLIIHGTDDKVVPYRCSVETKEILGDLCKLVELKNWGHNLIFHEDNNIYNTIIDYLNNTTITQEKTNTQPKF